MTKSDGFGLTPDQVPPPPNNEEWADHLRWCIAVMDADDDDLGFAGSLLSHTIKYDGLTVKQVKWAQKMLDRLRALWSARRLTCQSIPDLTNVAQFPGGDR